MVHLKHPENEFTKCLFTLDIFGSIRSNSDAISFFISILFWSRPKEPNYKCKHSLKFIRHSNALYEAHTKPPVFMEKLHCLEKNWKKELFACYMLLVVSTATDCVFVNALWMSVSAVLYLCRYMRLGEAVDHVFPLLKRRGSCDFPCSDTFSQFTFWREQLPPVDGQIMNTSRWTAHRQDTGWKPKLNILESVQWYENHTKYMCGSGPQKKMLFLSKKSSRVSCDLEYIVSRFVKISSMLDIFYIFQFYLWWSQAFVLKSIC